MKLTWRHAQVFFPLLGGGLSALVLLALGSLAYAVFTQRVQADVDEQLLTLAEAMASVIEFEGLDQLQAATLQEGIRLHQHTFHLAHHLALVLRQGRILVRTADVPETLGEAEVLRWLPPEGQPATVETKEGTEYRVLAVSVGQGSERATLLVLRPLLPLRRVERLQAEVLVGFGFAATLLVTLALALASRRALAPVTDIAATARRISGENLALRVPRVSGAAELTQLAEVINELLATLERSFAAQRQLAADAAHELKTPVAVIVAAAQEALGEARSPAVRQSLQAILGAASGLAQGIEDLVLLARAGAAPAERQPVALEEVLVEAAMSVEPLARQRQVRIHLAELGYCELAAERTGLCRAFANLLRNAVQYSPEGSEVEVTASVGEETVTVEVADRGPGIPEAERELVFQRFVRLAPARHAYPQGSGLGLAIVREVVQAHGGQVSIHGRREGGTVVRVVLPRKKGPAPEAGPSNVA